MSPSEMQLEAHFSNFCSGWGRRKFPPLSMVFCLMFWAERPFSYHPCAVHPMSHVKLQMGFIASCCRIYMAKLLNASTLCVIQMATSSRRHLIKVPPLALVQTWSIEEATHFSGPNIFGEELNGGIGQLRIRWSRPRQSHTQRQMQGERMHHWPQWQDGGKGGWTLNRLVCPIPSSWGDLL